MEAAAPVRNRTIQSHNDTARLGGFTRMQRIAGSLPCAVTGIANATGNFMKPLDKSGTRRRFVGAGAAFTSAALATADITPQAKNQTLQLIHSLRSIHGDFSPKPVGEEDVNAILDASVRAANASNMQSYSIVVSRDPEKIKKATGYRSTCLLLYCTDHTRLIDTAAHLGHSYYADNLDAFITSSTNAILAAQTAVIAARSLGIDSLLTNGIHRGDMERLWQIFDLPQKSCFPLIALLLGYPSTEPAHRRGRLKGPGVVHFERYQRLNEAALDALVAQYDDRSQHLGQIDDWDKRGFRHYLDWFHTDWLKHCTKPATVEGQSMRRLRKSGFLDAKNPDNA